MKRRKSIAYLIALLFLVASYHQGQGQQSHTLAGKVLDGHTGESLPGATILIRGTGKGMTTDADGAFVIPGLKGDSVKLEVSYMGYERVALSIGLGKNERSTCTIRLKQAAKTLKEVEVTDEATGQVKAFIEQHNALNIKNVVSSDQISKFPDVSAADAIQRIPGITLQRDQGEGRYVQLRGTPPELTNFNINGGQIPSPEGNVRYVGLDIIPADQIEFIEVNKVLTPDMDGDGIGGTVNIITKTAQGEIPEISALAAIGYNNLRQTGSYQLQFSYGQRYKGFGFYMNGSYYLSNQGSDDMEFKYVKGPLWGSQAQDTDNYYVQYRQYQLRHYTIQRQRIGISGTLDYKFNDHSSIYLRGMFNSFTDDEMRRRKIYDLDDAVTTNYYLYGGVTHDVKDRKKTQMINTVNLGGEHPLWGGMIDYEAAYAIASEEEPNRLEAQFANPGHAIAMEIVLTDPDWPVIIFPDSTNSQNAFDYDNYDLDNLLFQNEHITDRNITGSLDYQVPYLKKTGSNGYIKFGGKVRFKSKERNINAQVFGAYRQTSPVYPGTGPKLSVVTVEDDFYDDNLLNHGYLLDHMPGSDNMRTFYEYNSQFFIIDRTATKIQSFGEDYNANENIYATYLMACHEFDRLMLLGGVRYERTDVDYEGRMITTKNGVFESLDTLTDQRTHQFLLPQVQVRYRWTPSLNIRGAVTYTYSRPSFEDVLPYRTQDYDEVSYGNPDLDYPTSLNIDLLGEKYLKGNGILSGGIFFKMIDNFVFYYKRFAHEGDPKDYGLVEITMPVNGRTAYVGGAEAMAQSKLSFLPGFWKDFGVYLNYTFTWSEALIDKRYPANYTDAVVIFGQDSLELFTSSTEQEQITLPGQAMHTLNAALFYDNGKFYAKLSLNYHNDFLYSLGADSDLDEYYDKEFLLDFNANYNITRYLNVFVDVINLTNSPQRYYLGNPDVILKQELYSWWGRIGLKLNF